MKSILGMMSGSSLDGLDIAQCNFQGVNNYEIAEAETVPLPNELREKLSAPLALSVIDYLNLNSEIGIFFGKAATAFIDKHSLKVDLIVSHGHTIYHDPKNFISEQIGNGGIMASLSGIDTLCDLRIQDISIGGQGAPLASTADKYLFQDYDFLVNLGGIVNFTYRTPNNNILAWDVGPCNQLLNFLAKKAGKEYDDGGKIAQSGKVIKDQLDHWLGNPYYSKKTPKSIDNNWLFTTFLEDLNESGYALPDLMATASHLIATSLSNDILSCHSENKSAKILITGGGANNLFLISEITKMMVKQGIETIVPESKIVNYKEALLMAYMGYLYTEKKSNVISSATGAHRDIIAGALYLGNGIK